MTSFEKEFLLVYAEDLYSTIGFEHFPEGAYHLAAAQYLHAKVKGANVVAGGKATFKVRLENNKAEVTEIHIRPAYVGGNSYAMRSELEGFLSAISRQGIPLSKPLTVIIDGSAGEKDRYTFPRAQ